MSENGDDFLNNSKVQLEIPRLITIGSYLKIFFA